MNTKVKRINRATQPQNIGVQPHLDRLQDPIVALVDTMKSVDKKVKENQTSQDDNNGGRYWYNMLFKLLGKRGK